MAFDPDAYLAKKESPKQSIPFDPDAYLASKEIPEEQKSEEKPWYDVSAKGLLRGGLSTLPILGAMGGGALGTVAGPIGTVAGAGGGAIAGESLRRSLEKGLLDEAPKSREEFYTGLAEQGLSGAGGEVIGPLVGATAKGAGQFLKKSASSFSRVPEKVIDTYLTKGKNVDDLIKKYGGDSSDMAQEVRGQINDKIQKFKDIQNSKITKSLEIKDKMVDVSKVKESLNEYAKKLDPDLNASDLSRINDEIALINKIAPDNITSSSRAFTLQKRLQDMAEYVPEGQIFKKKGLVEQGFKKAAADTRKIVNAAEPSIADANKNLQMLRIAEKRINRNLLRPDMPEASLFGAGEGVNPRNISGLKSLEDITGANILGPIEEAAAARQFANAGLLPGYNTGAALIPLALGGGYAVNQAIQGDIEGAGKGLLFSALGSPLALKYGIQSARSLPSAELISTAAKPLGMLATKKAVEKKKKD